MLLLKLKPMRKKDRSGEIVIIKAKASYSEFEVGEKVELLQRTQERDAGNEYFAASVNNPKVKWFIRENADFD